MTQYGPQWNQLSQAQPNVSGLLGMAQQGINSAGEAASGILAKYNKGLETKGDQELARLLASTNDRDALTALVNSPEVAGLRLSEEGVKMLNQAQGDRVTWANTDSVIGDRNTRTGLAVNVDNRLQTEFDRGTVTYNEDREQLGWMKDNAGKWVQSEIGALNNGTAFSAAIDKTESGGGRDQYDTLFGHRNRRDGTRVSNMTIGQASEFASPSGQYAQSVNSEIGRVATPMGKFQIVGTTLRGITKDLGLPTDLPFSPAVQEQMGLYLAQKRVNGSNSQQGMRDGLRAEWEGFKNKSDSELDQIITEVRAQPPVTRESMIAAGQGNQNQTQAVSQQLANQRPTEGNRGFGGDAFAMSMADTGLFTPQQILGQVGGLRTAGTQGDSFNAGKDAEIIEELITQTNRSLLDNPEITSASELRDAVFNDSRFTPTENERRYDQVAGIIGADPTQLNPPVNEASMAESNAIVDTTLAAAERANNSNPIDNLLTDSRRLASTAEATVGQNVADRLQLGKDGQSPTSITGLRDEVGFNVNQLDSLIEQAATRNGVTPEIAAAAFLRVFKPDPWGRNTLKNRFDQDAVDEIISGLDQDSQRSFDERLANVEVMRSQMVQAKSQEALIRSQISQYPVGSPQRESLEVQLKSVQDSLGQIESRLSNSTTKRKNADK